MKRSAVVKTALVITAAGLIMLGSAGTVLALSSWSKDGDTINKVSMNSHVKGVIEEQYDPPEPVYPGGSVEKVVWVKNTGNIAAYPRIRIEKRWYDKKDTTKNPVVYEGSEGLDPELITIMYKGEQGYNEDDWVYNNGYYYYKHALEPKETANPLFDSFKVSEKAGGQYRNKSADIIIHLDMVQAGGDGLDYWFGDGKKKAKELSITYYDEKSPETDTKVFFNGPTDGFSFEGMDGGDLFSNFKNLIPGGSRSQVIKVTNRWDKQVKISLWAEEVVDQKADGEKLELIKKLLQEYAVITITDDKGNHIYEGPVWGNPNKESTGNDSMKDPYDLGSFDKGQTKNLYISLGLDSRMDNKLKELLGLIKWVFHAEGLEDTSTPAVTETTTAEVPEETTTAATTQPVPPYIPPTVTSATTTGPEETTAEPEETTAEPEETTAEPEETTPEPEETTPEPGETMEVETAVPGTTREPLIKPPAGFASYNPDSGRLFNLDENGVPMGTLFLIDENGIPMGILSLGDPNWATGVSVTGSVFVAVGALMLAAVAISSRKNKRR